MHERRGYTGLSPVEASKLHLSSGTVACKKRLRELNLFNSEKKELRVDLIDICNRECKENRVKFFLEVHSNWVRDGGHKGWIYQGWIFSGWIIGKFSSPKEWPCAETGGGGGPGSGLSHRP